MSKPVAVAKPTVRLGKTTPSPADAKTSVPTFLVEIGGLPERATVGLTFVETDESLDAKRREDRELGKIAGTVTKSDTSKGGWYGVSTDIPLPTKEQALAGLDDQQKASAILVGFVLVTGTAYYLLDSEDACRFEGDYWEVRAVLKCSFAGKEYSSIPSNLARIARSPRAVPIDLATHPPRAGNRLHFYNDGCADALGKEGALADMVSAIRDAKHFIFAADWSFHPLFRPTRTGAAANADVSNCIGELLVQKAMEGVTVAVHTWDHTDFGAKDRQNDDGGLVFAALAQNIPTTGIHTGLFDAAEHAILGEDLPANLHRLRSGRGGMFEPVDYLASSHHQKMLVVDYPEDTGDSQCGIRAFLGGLDLTKGRFDYAGHPVGPAPGEGKGDQVTWTYAQSWKLQSLKMTVDEWYNNETKDNRKLPRQPWHDVHAKLEGPAAWDYLREFVGRWLKAAGQDSERKAIWKLYLSLLDQKTFIPLDKPLLDGGWTVQVCRSLSSTHWDAKIPKAEAEALKTNTHWSEAYAFNWRLKESTEQSILRAYRRSIDQAERFIYIENQYFIGSGKYWGYDKARNDIPERLVRKILERYKKKQPFHVYIVMPMFPEGDPGSGAMCTVRALEYGTIKWMIHGLTDVMGDRWREYLSFYFLANWKPVPRDKWVGWHSDNNDLLGYLMKLSDAEGRRYRLERHQRYMIYVHTKMMIVDDRYVLLGSCNLNDRGLMGDGDSEIAISAWPRLGSRETCTKNIQDLRKRLWTEHLAPGDLPGAWEHPESSGCVDRMRKRAFQNYKSFREMGPMTGHLCLWHWNYDAKQKDLVLMPSDKDLGVPKPIESPEPDMWLPDASVKTEDQAKADGWTWRGDVALWGAYRWLAK